MAQIEGKFYPLQHDEWVRACQELTPSQRDVLYYIRTLDPYGNGVKITAAEIARLLSTDRKIVHRQTISRALKELDAKGFIDIELVEVRVKIKPKGYWCDDSQDETHSDEAQTVCEDTDGVSGHQWCDETPQAIATHQHGSSDTNVDRHTPQAIATHQSESKTQSQSEAQNAKTIKTYKEFKKTLSEDERENFLNFVKEQIKNLPKQVFDVEAWLANKNQAEQNRWEVYYNNFLAKPKTENRTVVQKQSLRDEIEQRRLEVKKRLKEASQNLSSNVQDSCTLREDEQNSSHGGHSDSQKEISRRREEAPRFSPCDGENCGGSKTRKFWLEQRRQIARERFEQGGES
jgi:Fe2+ or Zn2+ uptake regulation protein